MTFDEVVGLASPSNGCVNYCIIFAVRFIYSLGLCSYTYTLLSNLQVYFLLHRLEFINLILFLLNLFGSFRTSLWDSLFWINVGSLQTFIKSILSEVRSIYIKLPCLSIKWRGHRSALGTMSVCLWFIRNCPLILSLPNKRKIILS